MRTLYIDCFSGASGDMFLGALVDLGVDPAVLADELQRIDLDGYRLEVRRVDRSGLNAVKVDVVVGDSFESVGGAIVPADRRDDLHDHAHGHHAHHHGHGAGHGHDQHSHDHGPSRNLAEILQLIESSRLSDRTKAAALRVFTRLGDAEARAHGTTLDQVHFHEVGAVDAIVDVVGTLIGFELLGIERFVSSTVRVGGGETTFSHGTYPVPTPATAELLRGVPIAAGPVDVELLTPTGAALLSSVVESYGPMADFRIDRVGYGAGTRDFPGRPNVLRLYVGSTGETSAGGDTVAVIEADIDDASPEVMGYFLERALADGALDAYFTPVQMKKNRPGVAVTVLVDPRRLDDMIRLVFRETSTIGVRHRLVERRTLDRECVTVETDHGPIRIKVSRLDGEIVSAAPEYEDCREAARRTGVPLRQVYDTAAAAYRGELHGKQ